MSSQIKADEGIAEKHFEKYVLLNFLINLLEVSGMLLRCAEEEILGARTFSLYVCLSKPNIMTLCGHRHDYHLDSGKAVKTSRRSLSMRLQHRPTEGLKR